MKCLSSSSLKGTTIQNGDTKINAKTSPPKLTEEEWQEVIFNC